MPCGVDCGGKYLMGWVRGIGKILWGAQLPALNTSNCTICLTAGEYCLIIVQFKWGKGSENKGNDVVLTLLSIRLK